MPYGQFWDIRVTYGGAYDFDAANVDQMQHQLLKNPLVGTASGGDKTHASLQVNNEQVGTTGYTYQTGLVPIAAEIYRASYVPILDIEKATAKPEYAAMVRWLASEEAAGNGKLRINAHGDGMGNFYMADTTGKEKYLSTAKIADWLVANGLKAGSKLKTVNLAICLAAQGPQGVAQPQPLQPGAKPRMKPALNSAVSLLAARFKAKGCTGIKVTGSNAAVLSKSLASLSSFLDLGDAGEIIIRIPAGWTLKPGSPATLQPPAKCEITPDPTNPSKKPAGGWVVKVKDEVDFIIPQGWQALISGWISKTVVVHVPFGLDGVSAGEGLGGTLTLSMGRQGQVRDAQHSYFKAQETS
jgi:hypothetical protein